MMTTLRLCLMTVVAFAGSTFAQSQAPQSVAIESAIKSNEPAWELSAKEKQPTSMIYRWKSGGEKVEAEVFVTASPKEAADKLQEFIHHMPVPPKERLHGLGDEALLWQSPNTNGCMILFRRGNVFFHMDGSLVVHAKRFAKHLDDAVAN